MRPGIAAIRGFWRPFVLIQICAAAVVVAYYHVPGVAERLDGIERLKARWGYLFSFTVGIFAGAIVPEIFRLLVQPGHRFSPAQRRDVFLSFFYFGTMAVLCDGLYRLLDIAIGTELSFRTVVLKMLADQFLFTATLGTGIAAVYFPLYRSRWDFSKVLGGFGLGWYLRNVIPILLPAWAYWIPMCLLMYSMPSLLQVPFCACATAAWGLIVTVVASHSHPPVE